MTNYPQPRYAAGVELRKTYPAGIDELRELYLGEIAKHRAAIAARAERLPPTLTRRLIDQSEYDLAALHGALVALELHAALSIIVPNDHPIVGQLQKDQK